MVGHFYALTMLNAEVKVNFEQSKAFESVDHRFRENVPVSAGFGPYFRSLTRLLYEGVGRGK